MTGLKKLLFLQSLHKMIKKIKIVYDESLSRTYGSYGHYDTRSRTEDFLVSAGKTITISIDSNQFDFAVGAWDKNTKENVVYSGWNEYATYTPNSDVLVKYVFRYKNESRFIGNELDGIVTVTNDGVIYES
jgi:hypothetical protein